MESRILRESTPFFIAKDKDDHLIFSRKLIVRDGKMFALDFSHKKFPVTSASANHVIITLDGEGNLKQFSLKHMRYYPCSVKNGVYTMDDALNDVSVYNL